MTFRNIRFPTGIRYGAISGPKFETARANAIGGRIAKVKLWTYPLRKFRVDRGLRTPELKAELLRFFHVVNGGGDTFRIRDHNDYTVGATDSAATGIFSSLGGNDYQMMLRYSYGGVTKDVPCFLPITNTLSVNGGALTEGVHYTLSSTTASGVMTMLGSPGSTPTSWTGEYDIHASFDSDEMPVTIEDEELWLADNISITEERV